MSNTYTLTVELAEELLQTSRSARLELYNAINFMKSERYAELGEQDRQDFFRTAVIILLSEIAENTK